MTASQPASAASRPSPETTPTPAQRGSATPSGPSRPPPAPPPAPPTRPGPPMTAIRILSPVHVSGARETPVGGVPELRHAPVERLAEELGLVRGPREHGHLGVEAGRDHV